LAKNDELFEMASMFKSFLKSISQDWNKRGHTLSLPKYKILYMLDRDGVLNVSQLATALGITPSAVIGVTDQLQAEGYVRKERGESDRRVVNIIMTDSGKAIVEEVMDGQNEILQKYFGVLPDEDIQHLKRIFSALIGNLETTN